MNTIDTASPLTFSVDTYRGEVMLVLSRSCQWMSLPPEKALEIAKALQMAAERILAERQ